MSARHYFASDADSAKVTDAAKRAITRGCNPGDLPTTPATAVHGISADLIAKKIIAIPGE